MDPHGPSSDLLAVQDEIVVLAADSLDLPLLQVVEVFVDRCGEGVVGTSPSTPREEGFVIVCTGEEGELSDPEEVRVSGEGDRTGCDEGLHQCDTEAAEIGPSALSARVSAALRESSGEIVLLVFSCVWIAR